VIGDQQVCGADMGSRRFFVERIQHRGHREKGAEEAGGVQPPLRGVDARRVERGFGSRAVGCFEGII